jgi:6-phosphogluconolactonase
VYEKRIERSMKTEVSIDFELLADRQAVARSGVRVIMAHARRAIADRGRFRIVLAGGETPIAAYRMLRREAAGWAHWEVYFGDERCLPPLHRGRNSVAAREALLDAVPVPRERIFEIPAELGPQLAAQAYAAIIEPALPFDLVLLGMGEDGHTASLFPGHALPADVLVVPVRGAPKPPSERVSLSLKALAASRAMLVLVTGAAKREAVARWRRGADLPIARAAALGRARVLVDEAAAGNDD